MSNKPSSHQQDLLDIQRANNGDVTGFESIYFRYKSWVYSLALRFVNQHEQDAHDVVQEIFTYFYHKFPGFVLTANLKTFLYPVVKHTAIRFRDKRKVEMGEALPDTLLANTSIDHDQQRLALAGVIDTLSSDQREVVLMHIVDGMTLLEIAEALPASLSTVKTRLYRALSILKDDPKTKAYFDNSS